MISDDVSGIENMQHSFVEQHGFFCNANMKVVLSFARGGSSDQRNPKFYDSHIERELSERIEKRNPSIFKGFLLLKLFSNYINVGNVKVFNF